ncbi:MAG TPA: hypothetical protein VNL37_06395 [Candidatus Polarisedimenticolia bacterium]|nr:hypothetical protein [Candidatus Polarisedimenticolia bacterium]
MGGKRVQGAWVAARLAGVAVILVIMIGASVTNVSAIPAFARKYHTSCQTCHIAFPNLTPFGEAFRLNGYRFPAGTDASVSKDQPVALGAEGYKKLWPKSVWPGEMPGLPPVSMAVETEVAYDHAAKTTSFSGLPSEVAVLTGGTLGEHASFYGEVEFAREDTGEISTALQRVNIQFRPLTSPAFQIKVGSFEPGLLLVSNHRRLTDHPYYLLSQPVLDNQWTAEEWQQGIEFFGVVAHRLQYNAGYVEGSGNVVNNSKDYYGRVAYKFGGLRLDGTTKAGATDLAANPKPWSETSLRVSAFAYKGRPFLSDTSTALQTDPGCTTLPCDVVAVDTTLSQNDPFRIYGGDIALIVKDLIVNAGLADRTDRSPDLVDPNNTDVKTKIRYGEIGWVAYPWLVPAARWESLDIEGAKMEQLSLTINLLIRANVKGFIASNRVKEPGAKYTTEEVVGGVVFGF